jgi:hypothetical protein
MHAKAPWLGRGRRWVAHRVGAAFCKATGTGARGVEDRLAYRQRVHRVLAVDDFRRSVGSQTAWRMAMSLPADLQNSHQNGGRDSLIFVADPITIRLDSAGALMR